MVALLVSGWIFKVYYKEEFNNGLYLSRKCVTLGSDFIYVILNQDIIYANNCLHLMNMQEELPDALSFFECHNVMLVTNCKELCNVCYIVVVF